MSNYRAPLRTIQTDFRSGELDPMFMMRVDSKVLLSGARSLRNMLLRSTGGAERRPGMTALIQLAGQSRLIEYEFDANEKYVCAFRSGAVDIYLPDGTLAQTLSGPWNATTRLEMTFVQKFDVMIICHNAFKMRRLRRTGLTTFVLETLAFSSDVGGNVPNQPFMRYAKTTISVKLGAITGATTIVADQPIFNSSWVGEHMQVFGKDILLTAYGSTSSMSCSVRQKVEVELGVAPLRFSQGNAGIHVTQVNHGMQSGGSVTISSVVGGFGLTSAQLEGTHVITVQDADTWSYAAPAPATSSGDGGGNGVTVSTLDWTKNWAEQLWSDRHGWPGAIALHENRVWMGGSTDSPTFLAGSAVGDYYDFNIRNGFDDDSVQGTIASVSKIIHLVSTQKLQIFCEGGEALVETDKGLPITPGNFKVVNHTAYGADQKVKPRLFDGATIFSQRSGKNVREFVYDFNTDSNVASPVSIIASHMINRPVDMAVLFGTLTRPEQYAFLVNTDGTVAVYHSIRNEALAAWTPFAVGGGGVVESVCVIGTSVYFATLRSGGWRMLERFELDATGIWLDGAKQLTGTNTTFNAGAFYGGREVDVMAGGQWLGKYACDGAGAFTLPAVVTNPVVGFDHGVELTTLPPEKEMTDGPMTGEKRRVLSSTIHFHKSTSAAINGHEMLGYQIGADPSLPPDQVTAKKKIHHLGWSRDPDITITQPAPGPLVVLGMSQEVSI